MTSVSLLNFPLSLPPLPPAINFKEVRKETPRGGEGGSLLCVYYERSNANSKAQSGKPKGILKDEFCIPMFCQDSTLRAMLVLHDQTPGQGNL